MLDQNSHLLLMPQIFHYTILTFNNPDDIRFISNIYCNICFLFSVLFSEGLSPKNPMLPQVTVINIDHQNIILVSRKPKLIIKKMILVFTDRDTTFSEHMFIRVFPGSSSHTLYMICQSSAKILQTGNADLLRFCPQIFCQVCVHHITKVFPKELCFSSACDHCLQNILGVANVGLGLITSPGGVAN